MTAFAPPSLDAAVHKRYASLADSCGSLSCGGALDFAAADDGEVLVDLGSGRGGDVFRAARQVGHRGQAIGIDGTQAMVGKARAAVPADLTNVRFVCCDLTALALESESANVVISNCAINHARDKAAVYREIHRILRPGGRFVVSDIVAEDELPAAVRNDPEAWAACYGGAIPQDEYMAAIAKAGLSRVEILQNSKPYQKGGVMIRSLTIRGYKVPPSAAQVVEKGEE